MATQTNAPAKQEPKTVRSLIEGNNFKQAVASVLPSHLTPARFVRIAIAATTRTPKLAECDPNTVLQCLMTLSQFGLEPDGRNAHLIPFWNSAKQSYDCQLIIDYKGLAALAKRSGQVSYVHADAVCQNDVFEFNKGVVVKHEVNFKSDRGKPYAYYAMVRFKDGTEQAACMTLADVKRIQARSRAGESGPWKTDFDEMGKKTVFRRLSKWLELSPEFREALESDADALEELRFENALPIQRPKFRTQVTSLPEVGATILQKDLEPISEEQGRETTSGDDRQQEIIDISETDKKPLTAGLGDAAPPTGASNEAPSAPPPERRLKKKEPHPLNAENPNETAMLMRLAGLGRTKEDLVEVLKTLSGLGETDTWESLNEKGFADLLHPDNWKLIEEGLKG